MHSCKGVKIKFCRVLQYSFLKKQSVSQDRNENHFLLSLRYECNALQPEDNQLRDQDAFLL